MLNKIKKISKIPKSFIAFTLGFILALLVGFFVLFFIFFDLKNNLIASVQSAFVKENNNLKLNVNENSPEANLHFEALLRPLSFPIQKTDVALPQLSAKSAILEDFSSGRILFEKNINQKLQIGSLTKLISAIVALENFDINKTVKLTASDVAFKGSVLRFFAGEQYSVESLLKFALIESNNNAIYAIANLMGIDEFVEKMNSVARRIGLKNTNFQNPIGLDNENNYSTASDMAILLNHLNQFPLIKTILAQKSVDIYSLEKRKVIVRNSNRLVDETDIIAAKTGTTEKAGQNYAAFVRAPDNRELILIILNSQDRYQDAKNLLNWLKNGFLWQ